MTGAAGSRGSLLVAAAALLLACEGQTDDRSAGVGSGGGGASPADAGSDASAGRDAGGRDAGVDERFPGIVDDAHSEGATYEGPEYDGDPSCAPDAMPYEHVSCCEGVPCLGACELHGGSWQCRCRGVRGGCGPYGLVCCGGGCTTDCFDGPVP
ncbi:MAG: hypothetical protein IT376_00095 [Polyangiaceae bacterium]|nr:hypothetical protein [Polyangiaceae bacterium]